MKEQDPNSSRLVDSLPLSAVMILCAALISMSGVSADERHRFHSTDHGHVVSIGEDGTSLRANESGLIRTVRSIVAGSAGADVAIVASAAGDVEDALFTDVQDKLLASGFFTSVTAINASAETPTVGELSAFDGVLVWTNFDLANADALGDNLAQYVDNGGGVVVAVFANTSDIPARRLGGRWAAEDYDVIEAGLGNIAGPASLGAIAIPGHPLVAGVASLDGGTLSARPMATALDPSATLVASWNDGSPLVAFREDLSGRRADLGLYPPSSDVSSLFWDATTDGDAILANALLFVTGLEAIDVALQTVALGAPSGLDTTDDPESLQGQLCFGGSLPPSFVVELWTSDIGVLNTGVTGFYVDVSYDPNVLSADSLDYGALFPILQEGAIDQAMGMVTNFGGTNFDPQGIEPEWARIGTIAFTTNGPPPTTITTDLGVGGLGVFGRPPPATNEVDFGNVTLSFDDLQACCQSDGTCDLLDEACCLATGGTPLGDKSVCQETGACCYDDGGSSVCEELDPECCAARGGTFQGPGTVCGGTGACCFGILGGACIEVTEACCTAVTGDFLGAGSVCLGDSNMNSIDDVCEGGCPTAEAPMVNPDLDMPCTGDQDCANLAVCIDGSCYVPRNKYLSFIPANDGQAVAFRLTLTQSALFPELVGEQWWIQRPAAVDPAPPARLFCSPEFAIWDSLPIVDVADSAIVADATYAIQAIQAGCDISDPLSYSTPLALPTNLNWGDVAGSAVQGIPQPPEGATNFIDIQFCILGFQMAPNAPPATWLDVDPDVPNGIINLADAFRVVVAFQNGSVYPYAGPVSCNE
ncbi:MAG: hypothetical protein ACPGXK_01525 [Phycisphaerae bacterium]